MPFGATDLRNATLRWGSALAIDGTLPLRGEAYAIGRDGEAAIGFSSGLVSLRHARLERSGQRWLLRDLGSSNGLWWQGRRVEELLLCHGDRVTLAPPDGVVPWLQFEQPIPAAWRWPGRVASALLLATGLLGLGGLVGGAVRLPIRGDLGTAQGPLLLYDRQNKPLRAVEGNQHQDNTSLEAYPDHLLAALLASEDSRFWWHPGVDPIGTGRALMVNLLGGRVLEGGSTLTQQLARSLYPDQVGQGDTLARKGRELLVALQLEARFSKRDLLLAYLNRVYLGVGWGFEDASRHYFGTPSRDLSVEQAALLVGLLPSPNGFNPCSNPQAALQSRNRVLLKMVDSGRLGTEQARRARRQPIALAAGACSRDGVEAARPAPFYSDQVRRDLASLLGEQVASEGNFLVSTYFDPALQEVVERRLQSLLASTAPAVTQGAVVVLDSRNGGILAISGGRDYSRSQFNRASMALRQPGSTFKLFTYVEALERGLSPDATVSCAPLDWGGQHYNGACWGQLSLRRAFARSSNTAALRLAQRFGLEAIATRAREMGIRSPLEPLPGLVLGQAEVRLLELTAAYAAVANNGIWHAPSTIRLLTDGETQRQDSTNRKSALPGRRVMHAASAHRLQVLLREVIRNGTGSAARLGGMEGGKTGTTNASRDLLFVGYEPQRHWTIGIWLGNDDNRPTGATSALAAGLWSDIIRSAGQGPLAPRTRL